MKGNGVGKEICCGIYKTLKSLQGLKFFFLFLLISN